MKFLILSLMISTGLLFAKSELTAEVEIDPVGDFQVKSNEVSGAVSITGGVLKMARPIKVPLSSLQTGIELRDKHMLKYMGASKQSQIVIQKVIGKSGRGVALVQLNNKVVKQAFTYKSLGKDVEVLMDLSLKKYNISGINYMGAGVDDSVKVKVILPRA